MRRRGPQFRPSPESTPQKRKSPEHVASFFSRVAGRSDRLHLVARRGRYLIQECLRTHPDLMRFGGGLTSLRMTVGRLTRLQIARDAFSAQGDAADAAGRRNGVTRGVDELE